MHPELRAMTELHSRRAGGFLVRLMWRAEDARLAVAVTDTGSGDDFAIELRDGDDALDVFHHPYAYAAWRGVDTRRGPPPRGGVEPRASARSRRMP